MNLSAPEVARRVADEFEAAGIPYGVGGALALGVWGFPRATKDVDVNATLEGRPAFFISQEDLFFRAKDLIDVERLVAFGGPAFDRQYVAAALSEIVGADDVRLARWSQLLADVDAT